MTSPHDIAIIGAGPAGWGLAAACAAEGLDVAIVAPDPDATWVPNYGGWLADAKTAGVTDAIAHRWDEVMVVIDDTRAVDLGRPYVLFSRDGLRELLAARASDAHRVRGAAAAVRATGDVAEVLDADGRVLCRARVVVDACGGSSPLTGGPQRTPGVQTAIGWEVRCAPGTFRPGTCTLMDWRGEHIAPDDARVDLPSFLYALPFSSSEALVEETVLVARPPVPLELLEVRLRRRLLRLGIEVDDVAAVERCFIPMGGGLPAAAEVAVPFGAAAGMVHPATGYQVLRTLAAAPRVASAVREAQERPLAERAQRVRDAVWPREARQRQALYDFGMEALLGFAPAEQRAFFAHFFSLEPERWAGYLSDTLSVREVHAAMWALYRSAPPSLRRGLRRAGLGRGGLRVLGTLLG